MSLTILDLLPQSPQFILTNRAQKLNVLKFLRFIICHTKKAFELFYYKKALIEFDPHVGETLCQIRAYKLYLMSQQLIDKNRTIQEFNNLMSSENKCLQTINYFEKLSQQYRGKYNKILDQPITLKNFLCNNHLIFDINVDLYFLVQCLILTKYSMKDFFGISLAIDYEKLAQELYCGKAFARNLSRLYQTNLSLISCKFIMSLLDDLPQCQLLASILPCLLQIDNHKRNVLPCYEISKIIFNHMLYSKCPILLVSIRQSESEQLSEAVLFIPKNGEYSREKDIEKFSNKNCFVIKGITFYKNQIITETSQNLAKRIEYFGVKNIFLSNMAKHPQYSAKELEKISINPYKNAHSNSDSVSTSSLKEFEFEFHSMEEIAENIGCCQNNQSLFFVKHIFIDSLENQLKKHLLLQTTFDIVC